jgi:hypothetical protein
VEKVWAHEGEETPVIPDEPDVLDANDALQGLRAQGWRRVRRVIWWFLVVSGDQDLAMEAMN